MAKLDTNMGLDKPVDKSTCWYKKECMGDMLLAASGEYWPVLEKSVHWPALNTLLETAHADGARKILDLGCGAAALGKLINHLNVGWEYTGADMPEVIKRVAKAFYPEGNYIDIDIVEDSATELKKKMEPFDIMVMSGVLDVMEYPVEMMRKVLWAAPQRVIIHRQFVGKDPTHTTREGSYKGETFISHINISDWRQTLMDCHYLPRATLSTGLGTNNFSFLIMRNP